MILNLSPKNKKAGNPKLPAFLECQQPVARSQRPEANSQKPTASPIYS